MWKLGLLASLSSTIFDHSGLLSLTLTETKYIIYCARGSVYPGWLIRACRSALHILSSFPWEPGKSAWSPVGARGNPWDSHGNPWDSHGNPWDSHGTPWDAPRQPWYTVGNAHRSRGIPKGRPLYSMLYRGVPREFPRNFPRGLAGVPVRSLMRSRGPIIRQRFR